MAELLLLAMLQRRNALLKRKRPIKDLSNPFEMTETKFISKFRLNKDAAKFLIEEIRPFMPATHGIAIEFQVLATLKLLGSGTFQHIIAEGISSSQPSLSRYVERTISAIVKIAKRFISFPTTDDEIAQIRLGFFKKRGFPNVFGAIDCTHVWIQRPKTRDWFTYLDRAGNFSITVQMICDAELRILDVVARWPGSTHDAFIWNLSAAKKICEDKIYPRKLFLLGDNGYPLEPWLLTPFTEPNGPSEEIFNIKHRSSRNPIERCFGVLKSRFRCISKSGGELCYSPAKVCKLVLAVAVLHNICLFFKMEFDEDLIVNEENGYDDNNVNNVDLHQIPAAVILRQEIAERFQSQR